MLQVALRIEHIILLVSLVKTELPRFLQKLISLPQNPPIFFSTSPFLSRVNKTTLKTFCNPHAILQFLQPNLRCSMYIRNIYLHFRSNVANVGCRQTFPTWSIWEWFHSRFKDDSMLHPGKSTEAIEASFGLPSMDVAMFSSLGVGVANGWGMEMFSSRRQQIFVMIWWYDVTLSIHVEFQECKWEIYGNSFNVLGIFLLWKKSINLKILHLNDPWHLADLNLLNITLALAEDPLVMWLGPGQSVTTRSHLSLPKIPKRS